jgi:hypothetical protein
MVSQIFTGGTRLAGIVAGAAVTALALIHFVVLGGEMVDGATVPVGSGRPGVFEISRVGEEHLVQISIRPRMHPNSKGRALGIRLEDPDGPVLYEDSEIVLREQRFFEFVPEKAGTRRLFLAEACLSRGAAGATPASRST